MPQFLATIGKLEIKQITNMSVLMSKRNDKVEESECACILVPVHPVAAYLSAHHCVMRVVSEAPGLVTQGVIPRVPEDIRPGLVYS